MCIRRPWVTFVQARPCVHCCAKYQQLIRHCVRVVAAVHFPDHVTLLNMSQLPKIIRKARVFPPPKHYVYAVYSSYRLYSINVLPTNSALLSVCVHLTKLSLLLPSSHPHTLTTSTLITTIAIFIISYSLLRVLLFDDQGQSSSSQLLVHSGLLCIGLLLSIDTVLTPLWAAATHREPSGASLVGEWAWCVGVV